MSRIFAYCRLGATDRTLEEQIMKIEAAGFSVHPQNIVAETVPGSTTAIDRREFGRLANRLRANDVLLVTKLDRLGCSALDVQSTLRVLAAKGVQVHCLALGRENLTSKKARMIVDVLNAIADFELDLIVERTQGNLINMKSEGVKFGRPPALTPEQDEAVRKRRAKGVSLGVLAKELGVSRTAIQRAEKRAKDKFFLKLSR